MLQQICPAFLKNIGILGLPHGVQKMIDLLGLDPCKIVAYTDVELKSFHASQTELLCHHLAEEPGLDVFLHRLRNIKFRGPLTVVALIIGLDAWLVNTCGQFRSVHDLHGLKLKETAPCDNMPPQYSGPAGYVGPAAGPTGVSSVRPKIVRLYF